MYEETGPDSIRPSERLARRKHLGKAESGKRDEGGNLRPETPKEKTESRKQKSENPAVEQGFVSPRMNTDLAISPFFLLSALASGFSFRFQVSSLSPL